MRYNAVQRYVVVLVNVDAGVDVVAQKAAALRRAECVGALQIARAGVALGRGRMLEVRNQVAHRREPKPNHLAAARGIDELVYQARLKAVVQEDVAGIGLCGGVLKAHKAPLAARDGRGGAVRMVADGEDGVGLVGDGGGMRRVLPVGEQEIVGEVRGLELAHNLAHKRLALGVKRVRRLQAD